MVRRSGAVAAIVAAACGPDPVVIAPIVDVPPGETLDDLDSIELSVAVAGDPDSLERRTFQRGDPLELPGVPYGQNLVLHMTGFTGRQEVAYGRTCVFAIEPDERPSPHLYFARTSEWADAATPPNATRRAGAAALLADGSGLFIGGVDAAGVAIGGVDRFDPVTGMFQELGAVAPREGGTIAALGDGRVVRAGGLDPTSGAPAARLDVVTVAPPGILEVSAGALAGNSAPVLTALTDGRVVAFGGRDAGGTATSSIVEITGDLGEVVTRELTRAKLSIPRFGHTATRLSEDLGASVLVAGGVTTDGTLVARAELFRPLTNELAGAFTYDLRVPRRDHHAVRLPDSTVLIIGGIGAMGEPVAEIERFSLESGFEILPALRIDPGPTQQSVTSLASGAVLVAGGISAAGGALDTAFILRLDAQDGSVGGHETDPLGVPRGGHQAASLCDGTVLVVGGTGAPTAAQRYNPTHQGRR